MNSRYCLFVLIALLAALSPARAEVLPEAAVQALERFYHNFNGEDWRNNEGWLDPDVDPCDWHGVRCGSSGDQFGIEALELPNNNLEGPLEETDIFEHVKDWVDLQGNGIHGSLSTLPHWLDHLDLSDNELSGTLPVGPGTFFNSLEHLDLARNRITGAIPSSWRPLALTWLDLSNNRLDGTLEPVVHALTRQNRGFANLADNRFEGVIPRVLMDARVHGDQSNTMDGGINLCWNDLQADDPDLDVWLEEHHVGGGRYRSCLDRERIAIGPAVSGSWFDPERDGEGAVVQLLPDGGVVHYTFGFDNQGRQHWLLGVGPEQSMSLHWDELMSTRGTFGQGLAEPGGPPFTLPEMGLGRDWRMDLVGADRFHIERAYFDFSECPDGSTMLCPGSPHSDRLEYVRLSQLAGTTCDNDHPNQWISGAWYDPERDGEGFVVEVLEDGRGVVYWFTYRPDDSMHQAWMMGVGEFAGQVLQVDELIRPVGGRWGDEFAASDVEFEHWGSLTLEFLDQDAGHVSWDSVQEGFGSGEYPIVRLARVRLADCDGGEGSGP